MAHPYHHACSSQKRFRGQVEDYLSLHSWFDATKAHIADARHRLLRHQSLGIFVAEKKFGVTIQNSSHNPIPTRALAEQHVQEDFLFIPSVQQQCLQNLPLEAWMQKNYDSDTSSVHAHRSTKQFGGKPEEYRQAGKSTTAAVLGLHSALYRPSSRSTALSKSSTNTFW